MKIVKKIKYENEKWNKKQKNGVKKNQRKEKQ